MIEMLDKNSEESLNKINKAPNDFRRMIFNPTIDDEEFDSDILTEILMED